jgi:hypothetical protein
MNDLTYTNYNSRSLAVRGDRDKYQEFVKKNLDGKWNPRLKDGPGWVVPIENEEKLKNFINSKKEDRLDIISNIKKSRKEQHKYKRAISKSKDEDEDDDKKVDEKVDEKEVEKVDEKKDSDDDDEVENVPIEIRNILEKDKERKEEQFSYYKSFGKSSQEFKKKYYKEDDRPLSSSSENYSKSSEDEYPSPETPQPRKQVYKKEEDIYELKQKMKEMQKRMYMMELENKKKKI